MKRLLIVVDYQNDFVNGSLGFEKASLLEETICEKIMEYKNNHHDVIYTFDTHNENYLETQEGKNLPVSHCIKGTTGHKLYGKVAKLFDKEIDKYFEKNTFPSLELALYLQKCHYDEIEFCGLVTNICILCNIVMAKSALPEAKIIINQNATSSFDQKLHDYTLDVLKGIQVEVR